MIEEALYMGLLEALPPHDAKPLSTMAIWHAITPPKPSYGLMRRWLKAMVDEGVAERTGCGVGPQFYRWVQYEKWPDDRPL